MIGNPANQDIDVYRDRDFSKSYIIKDDSDNLIDISNWTVSSQIRPTYSSSILIAQFGITVVSGTSTITTTLDNTITKDISSTNPIDVGSNTSSSNMVWDLVVDESSGDRYTLITGKVNFHETVTREVV